MQPVYEYNAWYFAQDAAADGRLKAIAEYDALAGVQLTELGQKSARHLARIRVLPVYQVIFLLLAGVVGTLLFRKRDLK